MGASIVHLADMDFHQREVVIHKIRQVIHN